MNDPESASSLTLYYESYGEGRPVILLHGFGANHYSWRHLVTKIPSGYEALSFDLKGFGNSPKPDDRRYSLEDQADLIYNFIVAKELNKVTMIGHSMGGGVAILVAIKLAEENQRRLLSLVLIDSIGCRQPIPSFISLLQTPILGPLGATLLPAKLQVRLVLKLAYYEDCKIGESDVDAYAATLEKPGSAWALVESARQLRTDNIDRWVEKYSRIRVPTLILWGREDEIVPLSVGKSLHEAISGSRFVVIENCGHIPHEECAAETVPLIVDFLSAQ